MADNSGVLLNLQTVASDYFHKRIRSNIYKKSPLLGLLMKKGGGDTDLRPSGTFLGGGENYSKIQKQQMDGSVAARVFFMKGVPSGAKWMGWHDTMPTVPNATTDSHDQMLKAAYFAWSSVKVPLLIWNESISVSGGKEFVRADVLDLAVRMGVESAFDKLLHGLYYGNPTTQPSDKTWDSPLGIYQLCATDNTYGGIDRTLSENANWRGRRYTSAIAASVSLIDHANVDQGIADTGDGVDLVLCSKKAYLPMKAEALAKNGTQIHGGTPEAAKLGLTREAVIYGNSVITVDPWLRDYTGSSGPDLSSAVFMATSENLVFQVSSKANFSASPWENIARLSEGAKNARQSFAEGDIRFFSDKPDSSILYTNVQ